MIREEREISVKLFVEKFMYNVYKFVGMEGIC